MAELEGNGGTESQGIAGRSTLYIANQLFHACLERDLEAVRRVLDTEVIDINLRDKFGDTALMVAVRKLPEAAKLLVDRGANLEIQNNLDQTALAIALNYDDDLFHYLLVHGADISLVDNLGKTVLMKDERHFELILRNNKSTDSFIDAQDHLGESALMMATRGGQEDKVVALLKAGADTSLQNNDGITALMLSGETLSISMMNRLLQSCSTSTANKQNRTNGETALSIVTRSFADKRKKRNLVLPSEECLCLCILLLLRAGADANIRDDRGKTALQNLDFLLLKDENLLSSRLKKVLKYFIMQSIDFFEGIVEDLQRLRSFYPNSMLVKFLYLRRIRFLKFLYATKYLSYENQVNSSSEESVNVVTNGSASTELTAASNSGAMRVAVVFSDINFVREIAQWL